MDSTQGFKPIGARIKLIFRPEFFFVCSKYKFQCYVVIAVTYHSLHLSVKRPSAVSGRSSGQLSDQGIYELSTACSAFLVNNIQKVADVWESENCLFSKTLIRRHILVFICNFLSKTMSLIWHTVISGSNLTLLLKSFRKVFNLDIKATWHHVHHWKSTSGKYSLLWKIYFTFNSSASVDTILHNLSSL